MTASAKRLPWAAIALALAATMAGTAPASAQIAAKPNVLPIVGDDVGYGDLGACPGGENPDVPTPDLDRIAAYRPAR